MIFVNIFRLHWRYINIRISISQVSLHCAGFDRTAAHRGGYASSPWGPYFDIGGPLMRNVSEGVIDLMIYQFSNGAVYLI
jgi:hypothetical protein